MHRVVITGAGTINPLGHDTASTLRAFQAGNCGIGPLDIPDVDRLSVQIGAQVKSYDPDAHFSRQEQVLYDRATQFALISGAQAMAQAGGGITDPHRAGAILGTAAGGMQTWDDNYRAVYQQGKNRVHPFVVPKLMNNAAVSHLSIVHGLMGPSFTVSTACASSNHAMGLAFQMIRSGAADVMLTGGAEAMLTFGGIKAWEGLRVMSKTACRPFCNTRDGMVQGEGAGVFVFERRDHAINRGAEILAEVAGFAMGADASDIVAPSRTGAVRCMQAALGDAGVNPGDVGYINAHGTGTTLNDKTEAAAINDVFGPNVADMAVSSTKSMHGHLIGATGAVELLACIMALRDHVIAPTIGHVEPDPDINLNITANTATHKPVDVAISNAMAFGGLNAVLVLKRG